MRERSLGRGEDTVLRLVMIACVLWWSASYCPAAGRIHLLTVEGAIDPPVAEYLVRAVDEAGADASARLVLLKLNTPGGLSKSMDRISASFLASRVPVCVYVAPTGARAASAGAVIALSAHFIAMAPATNIGAATPIDIGGRDLDRKVTSDAAARIRAIAARRDRPVAVAGEFVTSARSLSVDEAVRLGVADVAAGSDQEVLARLDGRTRAGVTLALRGADVIPMEMPWRLRALHVLANPNVAYLLLLLAIYAILAEFSHPGAVFPGVVGAIAGLLAFYGLAVLSVNIAGLLLVLLAVGLFVGDAVLPGHGTLSLGGIVAFALGSLMLFPAESGRISPSVVTGATLFSAALFAILVTMAVRTRFRPAYSGVESARGSVVRVRTSMPAGGRGWVWYEGALWLAVSEAPLKAGDSAEILSAEGLTLKVRPCPRV